MPKSGKRWFQLREDFQVEAEIGNDLLFESLISRMISKNELARPSANQIASWGPFKTEVSRRKESLIQMLEAELKNSTSQHSLGIIPIYQTANVFKWHSSAILCSNEIGAKCFTMHSNMFFLQLLLVFILSSPWDGSRPRISFCRSFILPVFQTIALTGSQALVSILIG